MARRNKLLVPEARQRMDELKAKVSNAQTPEDAKYEVAKEMGIPLKKGYNGQLTTKEAGTIGGHMGGQMVKELIKRAQQELEQKNM
ncbi:alpha/beta-type small acid-soluble spore protein [Halobacillus mangrovi]|uniref:Alpha/beta hydrolase n=1 Tax=Halobacillus mangrovi TaxID=402384 RepID=A0A1W5ZTM3_9BACI|nr:alpha/beta-type small acid-soluble spore protein [Halobacillus mangrovi]ARI76639.1 alpha/beta hydrolase [Halobacillus mangrovi]